MILKSVKFCAKSCVLISARIILSIRQSGGASLRRRCSKIFKISSSRRFCSAFCKSRLESCESCEQRFCSGKAGEIESCSFRSVSNKFGKNFSLAAACKSLVKSCGKLIKSKSGRLTKSFNKSRDEPTESFGKLGALCGEKKLSFKFELAKFSDEFVALLESDSAEFKD